MLSYSDHHDTIHPAADCAQCGDSHSPSRCPWADTCAECHRTDASMAEPRLCEDCAEHLDRVEARRRADELADGYGDWLRDQRKDEPRMKRTHKHTTARRNELDAAIDEAFAPLRRLLAEQTEHVGGGWSPAQMCKRGGAP